MRAPESRDPLIARLRRLHVLVSAAFLAIASSYWFVQVVEGTHYRELADNNRLRRLPVTAPRGLVVDRNGELLVENVPSYNLYLDREQTSDLEESLRFAAGIVDKPPAALQAAMALGDHGTPGPLLVAENLALAQVARFGVAALEHPEFEIQAKPLRLYRHGPQTAHLLGYLGEVGEADLKSGKFKSGDLVGKKGIERQYDPLLRGRDGEETLVVDSRGRPVSRQGGEPATPGGGLQLTLDLRLQQEAERQMRDRVGAIVAMDPRNGEILALYSSPSYDPNVFSHRLGIEEWKSILEAPYQPLQNRVIQNAHSPGSVFKIVMATAALTEHIVDEHSTVFCGGGASFYGRTFRCWRPGGHGSVDVRQAIASSCDVYFYTVGQRLGIEKIAKYSRLLGLGALTGIDLEGEKPGIVPDPEWSLAARKHRWYPGETISVSIGQGPILTTPLQVAVMLATVANGGNVVTPHVRRGEAPPPRHVALDPQALEAVRDGLWQVVNGYGTAARSAIKGLDIAGKTGTAQVVAQNVRTTNDQLPFEKRDHAWFASFAPSHDPRLVVVVFVEHGGHGSDAAAPIAKALYEIYFADLLRSQPA